jgi:hypothetical protein
MFYHSLALALSIFLISFIPVSPLYAWGAEGHYVIAEMAWHLISSKTKEHVKKILALGGDSKLTTISYWADEVREAGKGTGPLASDPDAIRFNRAFPSNEQWHFIDLPLDATSELTEKVIQSSNNHIIRTIERCIKVLESAQQLPNEPTQPEALRLLVHFVGDLHQPLHCTSGFYDLKDLQNPHLICILSE